MIFFSDITLNESKGDFSTIVPIMGMPKWMIRTEATIASEDQFGNASIAATYILHLWHDGKVSIMNTDRPLLIDNVPDDDLRELNQWCKNGGWKELSISGDLLGDPQGYDFWMRQYRAGIIQSDVLKKYDEAEMNRLQRIVRTDQELEE